MAVGERPENWDFMQDDYPIVKVVWADHWVDHGDTTLDEIKKEGRPYRGKYVGYLVYEDDEMVVLCSNEWECGGLSDPMYIMKRCILYRSDGDAKVSDQQTSLHFKPAEFSS